MRKVQITVTPGRSIDSGDPISCTFPIASSVPLVTPEGNILPDDRLGL
jgi:hypothetical protein